jgi:16S rRNA processing protein RimM
MTAGPDDLVVGRIGPARGVRGQVFVRPFTDDPDNRFAPGSVLRTDPADAGPLTVTEVTTAAGKLVVHFSGIGDRDAATALRGVWLVIAAVDRPGLDDPDEFYDTELIGLVARLADGSPLGAVRDVVHTGGADYLVLRTGGAGCAGGAAEQLVPFVGSVVPTVDVAAGFVEIDPPEGLLQL